MIQESRLTINQKQHIILIFQELAEHYKTHGSFCHHHGDELVKLYNDIKKSLEKE